MKQRSKNVSSASKRVLSSEYEYSIFLINCTYIFFLFDLWFIIFFTPHKIKYFHTWLWSTLSLLAGEKKITTVKKSVSNPVVFFLIAVIIINVMKTPLSALCLTVEFPAVLLNTSTGNIDSEFHTFVQPQEHPILSEFCTELTGITQVSIHTYNYLRSIIDQTHALPDIDSLLLTYAHRCKWKQVSRSRYVCHASTAGYRAYSWRWDSHFLTNNRHPLPLRLHKSFAPL